MIKDRAEFRQVAESLDYRFSKTRAKTNPHEYCWATPKEIDKLHKVRACSVYIRDNYDRIEQWGVTKYKTLFCNKHKYWIMSDDDAPVTTVLNRNWDYLNRDGTLNRSETNKRKEH